MQTMEREISSTDAAEIAGVSYRQLDYWTRARCLRPIDDRTGTGYPRRFAAREMLVVCVVARLAELGCQRDVLDSVATMVRAMSHQEWHGDLIVSRSGAVARADHLPLSGRFGEACWVVNLELCARRAGLA